MTNLYKTQTSLEKKLSKIQTAEFLSIDTEFMRRKNFFAEPALLQIKCDDEVLLIDLVSIQNTDLIKSILRSENPKKIIHSATEDLQIFYHSYNSKLENFFDSQIMAQWLLNKDEPLAKLSYAKLVKLATGVELAKAETRSNWIKRPLSQSQLNYAAEDVEYLLKIYHFLLEQKRTQQRVVFDDVNLSFFEIAQVESDYLAKHIGRAFKYPTDYRLYDTNAKLSREELAHLSAINEWRLEAAKLHDLPIKWVLSDHHMIELAKNKTMYKQDFLESNHINPVFIRKYGAILLDLLHQNLESLEHSNKFSKTLSNKNNRLKNLTDAWNKNILEFEKDFCIREGSLISSKIKYLMLLDYIKDGEIKKHYNLTQWRFKAVKQCFPK